MTPQQEMMKLFNEELKNAKDEQDREILLDIAGRYEGPDEVVPMQEVVDSAKKRTKNLRAYSTGLEGLDDILEAFRDTELIVIGGPTKNGKTTLAMSITRSLLGAKHVPCWFSYEMTEMEFADKIGEENLPVIYTPRELKTNDTNWVESKIMEAIRKYQAQLFFIDHLHYVCDLTGNNQKENISVRIGHTMRRLKLMARKWGVVIVVLTHTTKIPATQQPTISALRDSSFIGQEANTVIYVRRKGEETAYEDETEVFVIANRRNGTNGKTDVVFNKQTKMLDQVYQYGDE